MIILSWYKRNVTCNSGFYMHNLHFRKFGVLPHCTPLYSAPSPPKNKF